MSDISCESSDDLYVPRDSENSETSDSVLSSDGDASFDDGEPIECEGWKVVSNIFTDNRPGAILPLSDEHGVLRKLKHIFPNTYQRIKSIRSPAKGGTGCYRFNYQPGS